MPNHFNLILDTTPPSGIILNLNDGAQYATQQLVNISISTSDSSTTSYQMKIWGNVDTAHDTAIQATEAASQWISFSTTKQVKLASGDGSKSISVKVRDDVYNESGIATDSIIVNTAIPVVSVTAADVTKISKIEGKNVASFSFTVDTPFVEYKVKVVSSTGASHDSGILIGTTSGSANMSGTGTFAATTPISCQINGTDLETASSGDGTKIIKVFCLNQAGIWST